MAINSNKNVNLQLTISKKDFEKLLSIQEQLNENMALELTKSQVVGFIIRNFESATPKTAEPSASNKAIKDGINYKGQLNALKSKLNLSWPLLAKQLEMSESTLKKYARGLQAPSGENLKKINDALAKYGIK